MSLAQTATTDGANKLIDTNITDTLNGLTGNDEFYSRSANDILT